MNSQILIRSLLQKEFDRLRKKDFSYNMTKFAHQIGTSQSAVSEILRGKRVVSKKMARRFLSNLFVDPKTTKTILDAFDLERGISRSKKRALRKSLQLDMESYKMISEWYHIAIYSLIDTEGFSSDSSWIAKRLGITERQAKNALERLKKLNLIEEDENGQIRDLGFDLKTTDGKPNLSIKESHEQTLELAKEALWQVDVSERDITSSTIAVSKSRIPEAKEAIREFRRKLKTILKDDDKLDEVYRLSIQLFPLSK